MAHVTSPAPEASAVESGISIQLLKSAVAVFRSTETAVCSSQKTFTKGLEVIRMQLLRSRFFLNIFRSTALAFGVVASIGIGHGTLNAQSRSASPRVILPLQVGFFNGATAF